MSGPSYALPVTNHGTDIEVVGGLGAETGKIQELVDADGKLRRYMLVQAGLNIDWAEVCGPSDSGSEFVYEVSPVLTDGAPGIGVSSAHSNITDKAGIIQGEYFWLQIWGQTVCSATASANVRGEFLVVDRVSGSSKVADKGAVSNLNYVGWVVAPEGTPESGYATIFLWPGIGISGASF